MTKYARWMLRTTTTKLLNLFCVVLFFQMAINFYGSIRIIHGISIHNSEMRRSIGCDCKSEIIYLASLTQERPLMFDLFPCTPQTSRMLRIFHLCLSIQFYWWEESNFNGAVVSSIYSKPASLDRSKNAPDTKHICLAFSHSNIFQ